ncbi:hypothetical protein RCL_jg17916.t1 [Rhizophagus clarus]|uniref:Uncharacterized protein n=1 Tax=Rhizophagus clarus TaxID=94130 RepID=A0A8H3L871_9GLOM|nr:hypothetical protein RCL_jg17916.t1 [Rhizophagus clarus]
MKNALFLEPKNDVLVEDIREDIHKKSGIKSVNIPSSLLWEKIEYCFDTGSKTYSNSKVPLYLLELKSGVYLIIQYLHHHHQFSRGQGPLMPRDVLMQGSFALAVFFLRL